jgi:hypothetical protein
MNIWRDQKQEMPRPRKRWEAEVGITEVKMTGITLQMMQW